MHTAFNGGVGEFFMYSLYYLRLMMKLPNSLMTAFLIGEQGMHQQSGLWNAIWFDQYI